MTLFSVIHIHHHLLTLQLTLILLKCLLHGFMYYSYLDHAIHIEIWLFPLNVILRRHKALSIFTTVIHYLSRQTLTLEKSMEIGELCRQNNERMKNNSDCFRVVSPPDVQTLSSFKIIMIIKTVHKVHRAITL